MHKTLFQTLTSQTKKDDEQDSWDNQIEIIFYAEKKTFFMLLDVLSAFSCLTLLSLSLSFLSCHPFGLC